MEGLTITEMAEILKISPRAVLQRLLRAGVSPKTKEAIYDAECIDLIREPSKGGRPRKSKDEDKAD